MLSVVEIVRGGAASLYGESAFTGVVSVERNSDFASAITQVGVGTYSSYEASLATKLPFTNNLNFSGLFHYKDDKGPKAHHRDSSMRIHPRPENYGLKLSLNHEKGWSAYLMHFFNRYDTPLAHSGYPVLPEDKEPFGSHEKAKFSLAGLRFERTFGNLTLNLRPYLQLFSVDTPQLRRTLREGNFHAQDIELKSRGFYLEGQAKYALSRGDFLMGFKLGEEKYSKTVIRNYTSSFSEISYKPKEETLLALYSQLRYRLSPNFLLNAGLRYDYYEEAGEEFSPRIALIYSPTEGLNFLLSHTRSFQAPPFLYRQSNLAVYGSEKGLSAEKMETYTISALYKPSVKSYLQATFYLEKASNLIEYDSAKKLYRNAGKMTL